MEGNLPVKNIVRLNWLLTVVVSTIVFLFLLTGRELKDAGIFFLMSLVIISLIGFGNLFILIIQNRWFSVKFKHTVAYRYLVSYLMSLIIYLIVWPFFSIWTNKSQEMISMHTFLIFLLSSVMINSFIIIMHNFVLLLNAKAHADLEFAQLKTAHAEAANLLLRQQIHPHFLFNALNTLRLLYRKEPNNADSYLLHLANFLRASVSNHETRIATLDEELELVNDYVALQKIRFRTAFNYTASIPDDTLNKYYLPSFSLQPLVENAIKHNELTEEMPLHVTVRLDGDHIVVGNNLRPKSVSEVSTGNGLANLSERYRLSSGDEILIGQDEHQFTVSIKLLSKDIW